MVTVAQLDRVPECESGCCKFKSCRSHLCLGGGYYSGYDERTVIKVSKNICYNGLTIAES